MEQIFLDRRLAAAAGLVRPDSRAADIGCDHGKLSVFLVQHNICKKVIAADLRPGPLAAAKALVAECGLTDRIDCRLGDGLSVVAPGEAEEIIIAGMGGETIAGILERADWTRDKALGFVFVPATCHTFLRRWLYENGFALTEELPVEQSGHWYTVMRAVYTGNAYTPEEAFCAAGLHLGRRTAETGGYLSTVLYRLRRELSGKRQAGRYGDLAPLEALCKTIEKEVEACLV